MKRALFAIVILLSLCAFANAQSIDELLTHYVQLRTEGKESTDLLFQISSKYDKLKPAQKSTFRKSIMTQITDQLRAERKDVSLSLISLYKSICPDNDATLNNLYYAEGCIHAENGDTTSLKFSINNLERNAAATESNTKKDIAFLKDALNRITRKTRVMNNLNGYWVSDITYTHNPTFTTYQKLVLALPRFTGLLQPSSTVNGSSKEYPMDMFVKAYGINLPPMHSQWFVPYANDSVYICWSNETLHNFNPGVSTALRQMTSQGSTLMAASMIDRNSSLGDKVKATAAAGMVEGIMNSIFDAMFTPTKKVWVLEARMRIINEFEMKGTIRIVKSVTEANGSNRQYEEENLPLALIRWDDNWPIQYLNRPVERNTMGSWYFPPWTPSMAYIDLPEGAVTNKQFDNKFRPQLESYVLQPSVFKKASELVNGTKLMKKFRAVISWNNATCLQMIRLHKQRMYDLKLTNGEDDAELKLFLDYPNLGVRTIHVDTTDPMYKNVPFEQGIEITEIETGSFQVAEFKKGYIIGSIDGNPMSYHEDLVNLINSHKVGDEVEVEYVEKGSKKPQKVKVTLY